MRIAILGSSSKLAAGYLRHTSFPSSYFLSFSRSNLQPYSLPDLSTSDYVISGLQDAYFDVVINFVALTDVLQCEKSPHLDFALNSVLPKNLSRICSFSSTHFIHISTDMVYDAENTDLSSESQVNLPRNMYAYSKYCGESFARTASDSTVLRTNFYGLFDSSSLFDFFWNSFLDNVPTINGYSDILFSPISISSFSLILDNVISQKLTGTYNLGSIGSLSKYEFAVQIKEALSEVRDVRTTVNSIRSDLLWPNSDFKSHNMSMDCSLLQNSLDLKLPEVCYDLKNYTLGAFSEHLRHS